MYSDEWEQLKNDPFGSEAELFVPMLNAPPSEQHVHTGINEMRKSSSKNLDNHGIDDFRKMLSSKKFEALRIVSTFRYGNKQIFRLQKKNLKTYGIKFAMLKCWTKSSVQNRYFLFHLRGLV